MSIFDLSDEEKKRLNITKEESLGDNAEAFEAMDAALDAIAASNPGASRRNVKLRHGRTLVYAAQPKEKE